jgi:spore coat protein U-like protein
MSIRKSAMYASALVAAALLLSPLSRADAAGTATTTMGVSLTITAGCTVSAAPVAFASASVLSTVVAASGSVTPTCTNTTPYTISLDQGAGSGASVAARKMTGPASATVTYSLYQDAAFSTVWGNTAGAYVSGTGNGSAQPLVVYGRVPAQSSPAPGAYADVVNVTVAF